MTRPRKQTVDYFPHSCHHGKTMFILEQRYGNDGYAFWFKLLELLGSSEGHFFDCNDTASWEFLQSITRIGADICTEILDLLGKLQAIDLDLWNKKIIWSDNFVIGVSDVYRNRRVDIPQRPDNYTPKTNPVGISTRSNPDSQCSYPQSKVKESKVKESKYISPPETEKPSSKKPRAKKNSKTPLPENFQISDEVREWAKKNNHGNLEAHLEAFKLRAQAKGYEYANWDAAFKTAIRENWGKIEAGGNDNGDGRIQPLKPRPEPPGIVIPDPKCPNCKGRGIHHGVGPCACLHPET